MPGATGVVQEAGVPLRPSISTRQSRQEPKASTMSVAQSFGTAMPASIEARMIDVPSGTVTSKPSMVSVTMLLGLRGRRAVVDFVDEAHREAPSKVAVALAPPSPAGHLPQGGIGSMSQPDLPDAEMRQPMSAVIASHDPHRRPPSLRRLRIGAGAKSSGKCVIALITG